ncbi:TetR family transcriptional regulator [Thalassobaculum fulvum]|uniref:TetR family transcriptional regulator n=1 Tax=Thalassobaculum fulvum TaxID=1633335 RepID=UPI0016797023|nr:TetR family transcriptional regulator [Thalassobaculum fulvum]
MFTPVEPSSRSERRRRDLLAAARRVVSDGGFRDLQMLAVAAAAGTAVGTIYRYYPTKAELCAALVAEVSARELEVIRSICEADGAPGQRLRDAVSAFARRALHNRRLAYAMIAEPVEAAVDDARLEWRRRIGEALAGLIADGVARGAFRPVDPKLAAACVVGAFMEALVGPLTPATLLDDDDKLAADIAGLCLAIVDAPDPTEEAPTEVDR